MALRNEFDNVKAKFYADPKFAGVSGLLIGFVIGAFLF